MSGRRDPNTVGARLGSKKRVKQARQGRARPLRTTGRADAKAASAKKKPKKAPAARSERRWWPWPWRRPSRAARLEERKRPVFRDKPTAKERMEAFDALAPSRRILVVAALLGLGAGAVWVRAGQLQLVGGARYQDSARRQDTLAREVTGRRGRLLDRRGAVLASTVDAASVYAIREQIEDPRATARRLAPILEVSAAALEARLAEGSGWVYLRRRAPEAMAEAVRRAALPRVKLQTETRRVYGNGQLGAHVLGFVHIDGYGVTGVEKSLEERLRGRRGENSGIRDGRLRPVWAEGLGAADPLAGDDVVLTVDRHVQFVAEEVLERTARAHRARGAVAVVLDADTSEVLALASYPTFNPNNLSGSEAADRKNLAIASIFDPGSTSKIVTIAAALDAGVVTPDDLVDCEDGAWRVGNRTIRDASHRFGLLTVSDVMKKSSNIGAGKLGLRMGAQTLHDYLGRFGFGARTGLETPGEVPGILRPADRWREVDLVNIAFGQGVSVTPLQIAQAANVIAAAGLRRPPTLVRGRRTSEGGLEPLRERPAERVVSSETARLVARMMKGVTEAGGTAPKAAVPGFAVAGKTGTAQKFDRELRAYSRRKYVASFVGFLPAEAPEVTVLVLVDEPRAGKIYGGQVAGPAFREIAVAALASKEMYPSDPEQLAAFEAAAPGEGSSTVREDPEALEGDADAALERAVAALPAQALLSGAGSTGIDDALSRRARALLGEALPEAPPSPTEPPSEGAVMPDLRGLRLPRALARCGELGLAPEVRGVGQVHRQEPRPGARLRPGARCTLELRRDG